MGNTPSAAPAADVNYIESAVVTDGKLTFTRNDNKAIGPFDVKGPPGKDGPAGKDGKDGKDGLSGKDGKDGKDGVSNIPGLKGDTGPPGAQGATGAQGAQGNPGSASTVKGPQGEKGDTGPQGIPGTASTVAGPKGDTGKQGETGLTGPKGDTGPTGPKGDTPTVVPFDPNTYFATNDLNVNSGKWANAGAFSASGGDLAGIQNPTANTRINKSGIIFGGNNAGHQLDSAQISAGTHVSNSLDIVGMSTGNDAQTRKITMWAEGGLNVKGSTTTEGPVNITGGDVAAPIVYGRTGLSGIGGADAWIKNPDATTRINQHGIMFGGANSTGKEENSGQISVGLHGAKDNLSIIGMGPTSSSRKINMYTEGGLNMYGAPTVQGLITSVGDANGGVKANIQGPNGATRINQHGIMFGGANKPDHQNESASISAGLYVPESLNIVGMSDNTQLNRKIDMWAEGTLSIHGNSGRTTTGTVEDNLSGPTRNMKINDNGITFGGDNGQFREPNSAQITAGKHVANSLNIVGMSAPGGSILNLGSSTTRRIDMWAEGGLYVRGNMAMLDGGLAVPAAKGVKIGDWLIYQNAAGQLGFVKDGGGAIAMMADIGGDVWSGANGRLSENFVKRDKQYQIRAAIAGLDKCVDEGAHNTDCAWNSASRRFEFVQTPFNSGDYGNK
jgi:hypothetical protein